MKFDYEQTFDCDLATLEKTLFDPALLAAFASDVRIMKGMHEIERQEEGGRVRRKVGYELNVSIPSFAKGKIEPDMLKTVEEQTFDGARHRLDFVVKPNIPARWGDRFKLGGAEIYSERGGKAVWRVEVEVTVKVMLVGGMAERYVANDVLKKSYEERGAVLRKFLGSKGA